MWRVRNINVSNSFSSLEAVCFRAKENFQIYFLQTASDVRNIVLNLFSCFWRVRNFSNLFSSTRFWSVRNIDVSNLSSSSETACFWASENFQIYVLQTAPEASEIFQIYIFVNLFLSNLFSYFGRKFFRFLFFNLFLQQTSLVLFLYLHILCKNMSFQTRILFRYVYEWSKFFSEIISDLFSYYLNVSLRWASCFISQPFFQEIYSSISRKIELNSTSEIELFAIAFENNLLTDRYFVSGIEIVFHVLWFFYQEFCSQR